MPIPQGAGYNRPRSLDFGEFREREPYRPPQGYGRTDVPEPPRVPAPPGGGATGSWELRPAIDVAMEMQDEYTPEARAELSTLPVLDEPIRRPYPNTLGHYAPGDDWTWWDRMQVPRTRVDVPGPVGFTYKGHPAYVWINPESSDRPGTIRHEYAHRFADVYGARDIYDELTSDIPPDSEWRNFPGLFGNEYSGGTWGGPGELYAAIAEGGPGGIPHPARRYYPFYEYGE